MSRAAELMNKIGYKYHVNKMRRNNGRQDDQLPTPDLSPERGARGIVRAASAGEVGQVELANAGDCTLLLVSTLTTEQHWGLVNNTSQH